MSTYTQSFKSDGVIREQICTITADGAALTINPGFQPRRVILYDPASVLKWEWALGMPITDSYKFATGAMTIDTNSAIVVSSKDTETAALLEAGAIEPGVTFSAAALVTGHTLIAYFY